MRPFLKSWLTICLLMPLAAHATNREQQLPASFSGYTAKNHSSPALASKTKEETPVEAAPHHVRNVKTAEATTHHPVSHRISKKTTAASGQMDSKQSNSVVSRAVNVIGTPYRWGGTSPSKGFDCSGLVKYAFNGVREVDLPRTSNAMASGHGQKVDRKDLKPGDLLFFNTQSRKVNHVAIYLGNDRFVHAPRRGKPVTIDTLKKPYWDSHFVVAKRVLPKQPIGPVGKKNKTLRIAQR